MGQPRRLIYQIFVDRFADAQGGELSPVPSDAASAWNYHCGGSLHGICARMEHIRSLGVDAIYLTPVFRAASNHKYDAETHDDVDERFGGAEAFARLAETCSQHDMGLILDGVFNHVGRSHAWAATPAEVETHEPTPTRARLRRDDGSGELTYWRGHGSLPELDLLNPDVRAALFDESDSVVRRWLKRGATGWRIDCANDLGPEICGMITAAALTESAPDGVIGELMSYASGWLGEGRLDGVMNYYLRRTLLGLVAGDTSPRQAEVNFARMAADYPLPALLRSWNVLGTHDTPRLATLVPDAAQRRFLWALAFTYPGTPFVFAGDEVSQLGGPDPDNRRPFPWDRDAEWDAMNLEWIRALSALRAAQPALQHGDYVSLPHADSDAPIAFARTTDRAEDSIIVVANATDKDWRGTVYLPLAHLFDGVPLACAQTGEVYARLESGTIQVSLAPWQVCILTPFDELLPRYSFFKGL